VTVTTAEPGLVRAGKSAGEPNGWALAATIARRELRSGLGGFRLFLACIALGVGAIAAILSFARAIEEGLRADARALLGGDVAVSRPYQPLSDEQLAYMARDGATVTGWVEMRGMARLDRDGARPTLIQLKAVDGRYPLAGTIELKGGMSLREALEVRNGIAGAVVEEVALRRMGASIGDRIRVGEASVELRAVIAREPDRGLGLFGLGPRVMIGDHALPATGLLQPGVLRTHDYRVALRPGADWQAYRQDLIARFPEAGWRVRGLSEAGGGVRTWTERLTVFLELIGLAALLVGGVGVGNAVDSYLLGRTRTIAILKCVGAPSALVTRSYLLLIGVLAAIGVVLGLIVGVALPFVANAFFADVLPVRARVGVYGQPLIIAAAFGMLVAGIFALWPLMKARLVPAATLMRGAVAPDAARPRARDMAIIGAAILALAALTVATAGDRRIALWFVAGSIGAFIVFPLLARVVMLLARWAGRPRFAVLRLALANIHRPGAPTPTVMLSLGLGLTVLVAVALIEGNLQSQITRRIPVNAPTFFFVDIQQSQVDAFTKAVTAIDGVGGADKVPMLRGRITRIGGKPIAEANIPSQARWSIDGDRGLTYAALPPEGSRIVAGEWWPPDYKGPPLISFDAELAAAYGLGVGDTITVNVLGRDVEARIANLRRIDWSSLSINFVFVFAPGTLERAPQTFLATVRAAPGAEDKVFDVVTRDFANVTIVRVKEALENASSILANIGLAARVVGVVGIGAGLLVLAGAMLATQRRRVHDAVVMKVLGASRGRVLGVFSLEFAALGFVTALAAAAFGAVAAWMVIRFVMNLEWILLPDVVALTVLGAMALTLGFGLVGAVGATRQRPLALLRNE